MSARSESLRSIHPARTAALAACVLVVVAGCKPAEEPPAEEIRPVRVMAVEQRAAGDTASLTGTVQAQTEVNYSFRIDGRMIQRPVNVGDELRPGQLIAQLDSSNEESSLQSARAQFDAAQARLVEQRNNYQRQKGLLDRGFISRAAFDQFEANLRSAESASRSARSQVELAQNRLSYTRLVSDAGGSVASVGAEPGEVVPAGRTVVQVARRGGRDAVFDVPARLRDTAPANPEITVSLNSDPKVSAQGPGARSGAARRSGDRHVQSARGTHRPARRLAAGLDRDGAHAGGPSLRHRDPRAPRWSARARRRRCGSSIRRPRRCRCGRSTSAATTPAASPWPPVSSRVRSS